MRVSRALEALARDVPHPNAVRLALERRREQRGQPLGTVVTLPERVQQRDVIVTCTPSIPMTASWSPVMTTAPTTDLQQRALALRLNGLLAHWGEAGATPWIGHLLAWGEAERARRSLERRMRRAAIEELMTLEFMSEAANAIVFGPNGVGKSTIARNLAHQALILGHIIDLLRDCVWLHYGLDIQQALQDQRIQRDPRQLPLPLDPDPPF